MNRDRLLLGLVLAYAAAFRLLVLDRPFEYDPEGAGCFNAVLARNYLRFDWAQTHGMPVLTVGDPGAASIVFYPDHPPLVPLLILPFFALFGAGEWQTRLPISLVTLGCVVALYRLISRVAGARAGIIAAALFAATPMTLYFGGFPDVIGMPLVLFVLLSVTAYLPFHREPGLTTLAPFVGAFMFAGACDWPAYIVVPVFLAHFIATRPWRQWGWIAAFCVVACVMFAALYVYIAVATDSPWNWMAPLFSRRSAIVGGNRFTPAQWLRAALAFNRTYHTLVLLIASGLWLVIFGWRTRESQPVATVARLLIAWGVLYVLIAGKAVYDHEWVWCVLTPGIAVSAALLIDRVRRAAEERGFVRTAEAVVAVVVVLFASWTGLTTVRLFYPAEPAGATTPMELGRAIQAAAPNSTDVALFVAGSEAEPQLWFYGDRPLRIRVWSIPDFERRLQADTVDLIYDFNAQPWRAAATGIVVPKAWDHGSGTLHAYLEQRYPAVRLATDLADKYAVFDLRHRFDGAR